MPRIDRIHPAKRGGWIVVALDDGSILRLSPDTVLLHRLAPGNELSEQALSELTAERLSEKTRRAAANIVSAAPVSEAELVKRLVRKGYPESEAEAARRWLADMGILDDAAYAKALREQCVARGMSRRACAERMKEKGIPPLLIEEHTDGYPAQNGAMDVLVAKKMRGLSPTRENLAKVTASLARKGFTYEEIRGALARYADDLPDGDGET